MDHNCNTKEEYLLYTVWLNLMSLMAQHSAVNGLQNIYIFFLKNLIVSLYHYKKATSVIKVVNMTTY